MFTLKIKTDNAAFDGDRDGEVARILRDVADSIKVGADLGVIRDINGNNVGEYKYTRE